jgi:hypothetical protein
MLNHLNESKSILVTDILIQNVIPLKVIIAKHLFLN